MKNKIDEMEKIVGFLKLDLKNGKINIVSDPYFETEDFKSFKSFNLSENNIEFSRIIGNGYKLNSYPIPLLMIVNNKIIGTVICSRSTWRWLFYLDNIKLKPNIKPTPDIYSTLDKFFNLPIKDIINI